MRKKKKFYVPPAPDSESTESPPPKRSRRDPDKQVLNKILESIELLKQKLEKPNLATEISAASESSKSTVVPLLKEIFTCIVCKQVGSVT